MDLNSILNKNNRVFLALGLAVVIAVMVTFWLWSRQPDYRVLFSNYNDKDGGAIVAALEQMNVPYKFSEGGSAILVPDNLVHQTRLKIASMGLPKGGNVGFELLENQKFGVSQFVEQVNYQRALEGELEKSIQAINAVQVARVHLAIPKSSVFVHDKQKPTASVILNLNTGRNLDAQKISAIVHLVASSVPDLSSDNVTVVDQTGALLSDTSKKDIQNGIDPSQLKYIADLQDNVAKRVESIITPIVGESNVRAEATAEVDFSRVEQSDEIYKPNQKPDEQAVRSSLSNETQSTNGVVGAAGIPGALSNQPPPNATAPVNADPNNATSSAGSPINSQRNTTTNYEINKTLSYSQKTIGGIKRLTVAVVVNNKQVIDNKGKMTLRPLNDAEKKEISDLAKQAMGFNESRGDSLSIVNSAFATPPQEVLVEIPLWKNPEYIDLAKDFLKLVISLFALFMIYRKAVKPMVTKLVRPISLNELQDMDMPNRLENRTEQLASLESNKQSKGYQQNLEEAKLLAKDNPKMVANIVTAWANGNE
jgi:flagellar M-ring protein FliF